MYYKLDPKSKLHQDFQALVQKMKVAKEKTHQILDELGAERYVKPFGSLQGGIEGVFFEEKPTGWKNAGLRLKNVYYPKKIKENKDLLKRIESLPMIGLSQIKRLINFNDIWKTPGIDWREEPYLFDITLRNYEPPEGMIEILGSEYFALKNAKKEQSSHHPKKSN